MKNNIFYFLNNLKINRTITLYGLFFVLFSGTIFAQSDIPDAPSPARLYVNLSKEMPDFLSPEEAQALEVRLEQFAMNTSNQIVVLVVDDLNGYEPWDYAARIGDKWKIGQEKEDNGLVLLIKPTGGKGERKTFIGVGRGLESVIPDYTTNQIVENELLPNFKDGNFAGGIYQALDVLEKLSKGEFNAKQYAKSNKTTKNIIAFAIIMVIVIIAFLGSRKNKGGGTFGGSGRSSGFGGFWGGMAAGSMLGGRSSGGGFGGGGSGGFGGFGGGSFGGGGSGGSW